MPTLITAARILKRETASTYRGRPLVIELHPGYLTLRQKGKRSQVKVDYAACLELGYKILDRAARAEKLKQKLERKKSKR